MFLFTKIKQIKVDEAKELIKNDDPKIIDIRSLDVYNNGNIEGSVWSNKENIGEILATEDKSKPILCYCYKGISSIFFCKKLKNDGWDNVYSLIGGYDEWKKLNV